MIKNKKTIKFIQGIILSLAMVIPMFTMSAHAETIDLQEKTIAENEKYIQENFSALLESKLKTSNNQYSKSMSLNSLSAVNDGLEESTYKIQDAELLNDQGESTGIFATTYAAVASSSGNKYEDGTDDTIAVTCYSTIYYSKRTAKGSTEYCLSKVAGGYTKSDGSTTVKSQTLNYGEAGIGSDGNVQLSQSETPTKTSYSYSTGYSKYITTAGTHNIGCTYIIKLKKGSDTWSYYLYNQF
ncbi:MAG: hypothetical protein ACERKZ_10375 [Lachnotalea sp.]